MEPGEVAETLSSLSRGEARAADRLLPLVYEEMRRLAAGYLRAERPGHTLQPTALAHEAFIRMVAQREVTWQNRAHFLGIAARAMRRILVDHARRRRASKRGNAPLAIPLDDSLPLPQRPVAFDDLDDALERLARLSERQAKVVELRYFGGLSIEEAAEVLNVSPVTVKRDWAVARAWLYRELATSSDTAR